MRSIPHNSVLCISTWSYCILVHDRCNSRPCQLQQNINGRCKHRSVRVLRPVSTQGHLLVVHNVTFIHDRYTWSSTKLTNVDVLRLSVECLLKQTFIKLSSRQYIKFASMPLQILTNLLITNHNIVRQLVLFYFSKPSWSQILDWGMGIQFFDYFAINKSSS